MNQTPIENHIVARNIQKLELKSLDQASIREIVLLANNIQNESGVPFIRMEMGIPGIPALNEGIQAQINALNDGVASQYPPIEGVAAFKNESHRFIKNFLNININPQNCIPTVGAMQGTYAAFLTCNQIDAKKDTTLFIDPGFPVQKQQHMVMGHRYESFDVYEHRGEKLKAKLEDYLSKGNIHSIIYSNPNNPSWICLTEEELRTIGTLANKYDVIVLEDLAYFGMDFRHNYGDLGNSPFQPTVANYTDNYILFISSSKIFSYAGERIGLIAISDKLSKKSYPQLKEKWNISNFSGAIVYRALYSLSSGTSHSAQCAMAAMFKAVNDKKINFLENLDEYRHRASVMKSIFLENGFNLVYDKDLGEDIGDGFYFTISYPNMDGATLLKALLHYGVSAITLNNTGSNQEGLRACVSHVNREQLEMLRERIEKFQSQYRQ
ncbi:pyridoxal phosphate-dependent aminotransferase [Halosquirtibacter xylanolyticus]|uniref:aminotransferase class I/II-fold pyridoxal phosphate-dependent enzyme n=1 Tax=Halosquirtibacter xylanolyticus TaxID=3374599 RepID=UPI003748159F|nr:pyridoxal phosphate-dependent aminotransferase [Prolixibacteraceae bacterium]